MIIFTYNDCPLTKFYTLLALNKSLRIMSYPYQIKTYEQYKEIYKRSIQHPENFWADVASHFTWKRKWDKVLDYSFGKDFHVNWFCGAKLNITENCLDRHLQINGNKPAIIWEPNNPEEHHRVLTYNNLYKKVNLFANVLKNNGVKKGDCVCLYMGMIPELEIAVLACARIGAIHVVIFGGFSPKSIAERLKDSKAKYIVTCDGAYRGNKIVPMKDMVDDALESVDFVEKVIVCTRTRSAVSMLKGRDVWWEDEVKQVETLGLELCPAVEMDAEDTLFVLYTSGSTGKPKGVVHSSAGYMVDAAYSFVNIFQYEPGDVYFCTADIGWITGHTYLIYGPLLAGATSLIFEGTPTYPDAGRLWDIVDKFNVSILYTAPTAIRSLMSHGDDIVEAHDLSTLKVLGSVGEPINEEAWNWFYNKIGKGRCPIVDTWWQTETGSFMISNMAGVTPSLPGWATLPLPGVEPILVNEQGQELIESENAGTLCIKKPWPGMMRTMYGNHDRCIENYFTPYPNLYFTGDGAMRNKDGMYKITGRVDDVLNVSGHRIGTSEVEDAINLQSDVVECAVVGFPHEIKGQGVYAYVVFHSTRDVDTESAIASIKATITRLIGPIAKPDKIQFVKTLPKTRSGKIVRRILRKIAEGQTDNFGDLSTLQDPSSIDEILAGKI